eukprot:GILK01007003.1.p1 GENE.GILK01007003.1~~GILK01007003.1.p1  ORF type:complete len:254 (+),score=19.80 GILK01007003.1:37-762(+)
MAAEESEWTLYYWPGMPGRGEFMRLIFAETQTEYNDAYRTLSWEEVGKINYNKNKNFFAVPAIKHRDFFLSQTPVIVRYMATKLDNGRLYPLDEKLGYRCDEVMAGVVDLVAEGHDAWHAIDHNASYVSQKEATQPFIDTYKNKRLPKWFAFFEHVLQENRQKFPAFAEGGPYLVGDCLTYVDLCLFHVLDGIQFQCPEEYNALPAPELRAFKERIGRRPRISAYLASDRRTSFSGTGPIF